MYILKYSISLSAASELKVWLLYYSQPTLIGVLPKKNLQHFALFVEAMYILLGDNISREDLKVAENLLDGFYKNFEQFYGIWLVILAFFSPGQ